jgi:hypothetical protein
MFLIAVVYATLAPVLLMAVGFWFAGNYLARKYQFLYLFRKKYETHGHLWYSLYPRMVICIIASNFLSIFLMAAKLARAQGPVLLPLPFLVYMYWCYTTRKYERVSMYAAYVDVSDKDTREGDTDYIDEVSKHFEKDFYIPPNVKAPANAEPYPYRLDDLPLYLGNGDANEIYIPPNPPKRKDIETSTPNHIEDSSEGDLELTAVERGLELTAVGKEDSQFAPTSVIVDERTKSLSTNEAKRNDMSTAPQASPALDETDHPDHHKADSTSSGDVSINF